MSAATKAAMRCLNETAREMLEVIGTRCKFGNAAWAYEGFRFEISNSGRVFLSHDVEWTIFHEKTGDVEISETACCRIIYALSVGADEDVIRESLEK